MKNMASVGRSGFAIVVLFAVAGLAGCTKKADVPAETSAPAPAETVPVAGSRTLNLAIWSNYVPAELLAEFEKKTGIKVAMSNYSSNEEVLAKLQAGASGYDVVVPSDYMVFALSKLGLIQPLDHSLLPNEKSLDPKFMKKSYDPTNKYSVPYDWGTTGIAVNREKYKGEVKGWKNLFNNPDLAGKITMLDDARESIGAALKSLGYSLNSVKPEELAQAKAVLLKVRKRVKAFTSEPMVPLVNGETPVAHAFMSDALQSRKATGGKIEYIIPEEGGTVYIDNLVIPSTAPHVKEAHEFINFMLDPKSNVATVMAIHVAPANKDARALLPEAFVASNPQLFLSEPQMVKLEMINDLGDDLKFYDRIWTEVKAEQ